jgi:hypothetical protein
MAGAPSAAACPRGPDAVVSKPTSSTASTAHKQARTSKSACGGARHCSGHDEVEARRLRQKRIFLPHTYGSARLASWSTG